MIKRSLLTLAAATAMLAACATAPAPPGRTTTCDARALEQSTLASNGALTPQLPGTFTPIPLDQVTMLEPGMARWLMVQSVGASRTETNTMQVVTRLVNCTDQTVQVEGRVHFLASDQSATEPVSAWRRVIIPARSIGSYRESSVAVREVSNYLIELRQGR